MGDAAKNVDPTLPTEVVVAMEAAGYSPKLAILMKVFADLANAKAEVEALRANADTAEPMVALKALCVDVKYLNAVRAAKRGQLEAVKLKNGSRWFCAATETSAGTAATTRAASARSAGVVK